MEYTRLVRETVFRYPLTNVLTSISILRANRASPSPKITDRGAVFRNTIALKLYALAVISLKRLTREKFMTNSMWKGN
jgi:hypothetical protein